MAQETYKGTFPRFYTAPELLVNSALTLAWPQNTSSVKYKYSYKKLDKWTKWSDLGTAKPHANFMSAIDTFYPEHWKWGGTTNGYGPRVGASCDVGVGTLVRHSRYDTAFPRGLSGQWPHCEKSKLWTDIKGNGKLSQLQAGDIIQYNKIKSGGHILIYLGNGLIAQSGLNSSFLHIQKISDYYVKLSNKSKIYIHRATGIPRQYFIKGDIGIQIKYLQEFLNWAGFDCGKADGILGDKGIIAIKKFQEAVGLKADGLFGAASLAKAKTFIKANKEPEKELYSGPLPTKTLFFDKKLIVDADVTALQLFLNWYFRDNIGFTKIKEDGKFGGQTESAVKQFQTCENIKVDGIFGPVSLLTAKMYTKPTSTSPETGIVKPDVVVPKEKYTGLLPDFNAMTTDLVLLRAKQFSWPLGTAAKKRNYKTGSRVEAFTSALYKAFPSYKGKSEPYKKGASCSVFVATVVRNLGIDSKFLPSKVLEYLQKKPEMWKRQTQSTAKAGDIVFYWKDKAKNDYHTLIYGGKQSNGKFLWFQANANKQYPYAFYGKSPADSKYKNAYFYRASKAIKMYIERGDVSVQIKYLQNFLNWYGRYRLIDDGSAGPKTEEAIKDFQKKEGLVVDGKFGPKCLDRAKLIEK